MVGRNKRKTVWRILKIDRLAPTELNIVEDPTTYSEAECFDLLTRLREGNVWNGGLIIGFIRFLGPYYMLIITKRKQIGIIGGHVIYAISKSEMIPIAHPSVQTDVKLFSKSENRYKKLLCSIDLTKDFFFKETSLGDGFRAFLYLLGVAYCFIGLSAITARFFRSMEYVVKQTREVVHIDPITNTETIRHEKVWNYTIADITLLAFGTSFPQISLATIDSICNLGQIYAGGIRRYKNIVYLS